MQFQESIFESDVLKLMINVSGIHDGILKEKSIKLHFYAFDKLTGKQCFEEELDVESIRRLYNYLDQISIVTDSSKKYTAKFIESSKDIAIFLSGLHELDPELLKIVISKISKDNVTESLLTSLSGVELENLSVAFKYQTYLQELKNLEDLLDIEETGEIVEKIKTIDYLQKYVAGQPEKIFQNWIENNLWIFGVDYIKKHDARKIALFSEGDMLMESMDGFLDLIELKRPKLSYDIFKYDVNHDCYFPSTDLAKVIGQCLFYLQKLDDFKLILEKEYKVKIIRPRVKIILGRTTNFNAAQFEALRMLNSNLNHIEIVSFDYLLSCGRKLVSYYE